MKHDKSRQNVRPFLEIPSPKMSLKYCCFFFKFTENKVKDPYFDQIGLRKLKLHLILKEVLIGY